MPAIFLSTVKVNDLIAKIDEATRGNEADYIAMACMTMALTAAHRAGIKNPDARRELLAMLDYAIHNSVSAADLVKKLPTGAN